MIILFDDLMFWILVVNLLFLLFGLRYEGFRWLRKVFVLGGLLEVGLGLGVCCLLWDGSEVIVLVVKILLLIGIGWVLWDDLV